MSIQRSRYLSQVEPPGLRGYDAKEVSVEESVHTGTETIVQQQFRDEVDINTIVRRFGVTGQMPFGADAGVYGDFTGISDYESALSMIEGSRSRFNSLPPEVRERFGNDPGRMIEFAQSVSEEEFLAGTQPSPPPVVVPPVEVPAVPPPG